MSTEQRTGAPAEPQAPTVRATHWYAELFVLSALRLRERRPADAVAVALRDHERCRTLLREMASALRPLDVVAYCPACGEAFDRSWWIEDD